MYSFFQRHPYLLVGSLIAVVVLIDQSIKIWVKTNMLYGEEFLVFGQPWFRIHFVENEGMAYGIQLGGKFGKLGHARLLFSHHRRRHRQSHR